MLRKPMLKSLQMSCMDCVAICHPERYQQNLTKTNSVYKLPERVLLGKKHTQNRTPQGTHHIYSKPTMKGALFQDVVKPPGPP